MQKSLTDSISGFRSAELLEEMRYLLSGPCPDVSTTMIILISCICIYSNLNVEQLTTKELTNIEGNLGTLLRETRLRKVRLSTLLRETRLRKVKLFKN